MNFRRTPTARLLQETKLQIRRAAVKKGLDELDRLLRRELIHNFDGSNVRAQAHRSTVRIHTCLEISPDGDGVH